MNGFYPVLNEIHDKAAKELPLIDVLHELIAQETAQLRAIPMFGNDDRRADKRKASLVRMRKISKRDAYYRVIHILRGYDTEFTIDKTGGFDETN